MSRTARKTTTGKTTTAPPGAVKTSITFDAETYKLIRLAMVETGLEMSELVNALVKKEFGGWHIRKGKGGSAPGITLNSPAPPDDSTGPIPAPLETPANAPIHAPIPFMNRPRAIDQSA